MRGLGSWCLVFCLATVSAQTLEDAQRLHAEGLVAYQQHELDAAEAKWREALAIQEVLAPGSLEMAATVANLGNVSHDRGALEAASAQYQRALAIFERAAPGSLYEANCVSNLGAVAWERGDLDAAHNYLQRALPNLERLLPVSVQVAACLTNLGGVASDRGDLDSAEQYHQRALAIFERTAPGSLGMASCLSSLGLVARYRGDLNAATDYYQRAQSILANLAPRSLQMATNLDRLGNIAFGRGDVDAAQDYYLRALQVREGLAPDSLDLASSLTNLGNLAWRRGDRTSALGYFEQAFRITQRLAPDSLELADLLDTLGVLAAAAHAHDVALNLGQLALDIRQRKAPDSLSVAASLMNLGYLAVVGDDVDAAEECYGQAVAIYERLAPESLALAMGLYNRGLAARRRGAADEAIPLTLRAIGILEQQRSFIAGPDARAAFAVESHGVYRLLLGLQLELGQSKAALATLERFRARSLLDSLHERDVDFSADAPPDLLQRQAALQAQFATAHREIGRLDPRQSGARVDALGETIRQLGAQQRELEAQIRRTSATYAALEYPQPLDAVGIQAALDPGTLLLAYAVDETQSHLFAVTRDAIDVSRIAATQEELVAQVAAFTAEVASPRGQPVAPGRALYDALVRPAQSAVDKAERLLMLPDGVLHKLPWAALVTSPAGEPVRYLVEEKPLHQAVSMTVYQQLRQAAAPGSGRLVAFGDPLLPGLVQAPPPTLLTVQVRSLGELGALPFAAREARDICTLLGDRAMTLVGSEASERAAKTVLGQAEVIHFACHAVSLDDHPLDSSLVLADGDGEDGLLQAWEIFESVRLKADLVVLSACQSGSGRVQRHEGLIGLTRAFQYAGARSIIASVWRVADESTCDLMTALHRRRQAGETKDEALRNAQLELLAAGRAGRTIADYQLSHPYFWAPFVLVGDWQ